MLTQIWGKAESTAVNPQPLQQVGMKPFSQEDKEVIENLVLLENLDFLSAEDVAFLKNYEETIEIPDNEVNK